MGGITFLMNTFFGDIIGLILESVTVTGLKNLVAIGFWPEEQLGALFQLDITGPLYRASVALGITLILLKFLKKGFDTYVLWIDGEADADPVSGLINLVKALAIAICFPTIYTVIVGVANDFLNILMTRMDISSAWSIGMGANMVNDIMTIVFWIIYIVFYIQYLMRGLEMFILRLGVPLACVGLIDSDQGVWRTYWNKLIQSAVTIVVQMFLATLGLWLAYSSTIPVWGIAALLMAIRSPRFIADFLIAPASTNFNSAMHNTQMAYRGGKAVQALFKK